MPMNYGGTSEAEQKVTIRLDRQTGEAHLCSTWPTWSRKLERLYGAPKRAAERGAKVTAAFWTIPLGLVTLRRGGRRAVTEAQRQAARERLGRARQARSTPTEP